MPIENGYNGDGTHHIKSRQLSTTDENINEELLMGPAVQEIVSNKPGFLIRWGISIFFFILLAIFFACWFVQYPQTISARARLTSVDPPTEVKVKMNGRLVKLLVKEGDRVQTGDVLGYLESIADPGEIIQLTRSLEQLKTIVDENNYGKIQAYVKTQFLHLGEMQQHYQLFIQAALQFEADPRKQKILFLLTLGTIESQLKEWCRKYLLQAPMSGRVYFPGLLRENQQLKTDETICLIDRGSAAYYVEMNISQNSLGKIKTGQAVLLKFSAYPYQEYGAVNGEISFISAMATDSGYLVKIILPNGLITNHQKQIDFREGLTAQGEIIIKNQRLLERFYSSIKSL